MNKKISLNSDWKFKKGNHDFETVSIPHTPQIEKLDVFRPFQGQCVYEKEFFAEKQWENNRVAVCFQGVMQNAVVFINGKEIARHFGGYLPFTVDLQGYLSFGEKNIIKLLVDNTDDKNTPPGKPTAGLDFLYYGGIYRNVDLIITPKIFLTDAVQANLVNGGGLVISTELKDGRAVVNVKATVKSIAKEKKDFSISLEIMKDEMLVTKFETTKSIKNETISISAQLEADNPCLWSVDTPDLYQMVCKINCGDEFSEYSENFGIRTVELSENALYVNGRKTNLFGTNRHQQYPYIGLAASDNAQRREARLLKSLGINTVRLSHYPQSEAFLDECDKIGLMLIEAVPGWQFCKKGMFRTRLEQNVRDMVRRDRNHPSIIAFEVSPNETPKYQRGASDKFFSQLNTAAKEEMPNCLTAGDTSGRHDAEKVNFDIPYTGSDAKGKKRVPFGGKKPTLTREYGDWGFGGNVSTSRANREDGELAQRIQAWNFQWTHNENYLKNNIIGDLVWEGIDHNRGYFPKAPISTSGLFDIFRLPKFSAHFFESQQDKKAVLFPAIYSVRGKEKIPVYSNCEMVSLIIDGKEICKKACDNGETAVFDEKKFKKTNDNYWNTKETHLDVSKNISDLARHTIACLYDGGNCEKVDFPPFTFQNLEPINSTEVTFIGWKNGKEEISVTIKEPKKAIQMEIEIAYNGIPLSNENNDFVFVYVHLLDENRTADIVGEQKVSLAVQGGSTIGHSVIGNKAGIAPFMVMADKGSTELTITATANGIETAKLVVEI